MNISDRIKEISSLSEPEIQIYASLTEAQLCNYFQKEQGIFIAESPKVIQVALHAGYKKMMLLISSDNALIFQFILVSARY